MKECLAEATHERTGDVYKEYNSDPETTGGGSGIGSPCSALLIFAVTHQRRSPAIPAASCC